MSFELLPGTMNVVRLPSAKRTEPALDLLRELAPDVREVDLVAEQYGLEMPGHDFRHRVDAETAEYFLNQVDPEPGPARTAALRELLRPLLVTALEACHAARGAAREAADAWDRLGRAKAEGGYWLTPLAERAEALSLHAAELFVAAHVQCEEAQGAARAVDLALTGQRWTPFDPDAEDEWLLSLGKRAAFA